MRTLAVGVDIGGSHISCAAFDLRDKTFLPATHTEHTLDNNASKEVLIQIWAATIKECMKKAEPHEVIGIGFAMPGPFDYFNGIALFSGENKKYIHLNQVNVRNAVQKALHKAEDFPIRFINDATAFALGEDWIGKSNGTSRSLAITLGTGFGSAFLRDHLPVVRGDDVPKNGMVWHLAFEGGTADDYFSTRGLINRYFMASGKALTGVKDLASLAKDDSVALQLFQDFGKKLGLFLEPWIQKFQVEILVIGGNISNAFHLFGTSLLDYFNSHDIPVQVEISALKEKASFIGAAVLVDDSYYEKVAPFLIDM